jgi:hypothetical protein
MVLSAHCLASVQRPYPLDKTYPAKTPLKRRAIICIQHNLTTHLWITLISSGEISGPSAYAIQGEKTVNPIYPTLSGLSLWKKS